MIPRFHEDEEMTDAGALPKGSKTVSLSHTDNATVLPQRTDAWSDVRRSASRQYIEIAKSAESDSGKTSILTALLHQEENHGLLECFRGEGQWHGHGTEAHFEGAPNWRVVIAKLESIVGDTDETSRRSRQPRKDKSTRAGSSRTLDEQALERVLQEASAGFYRQASQADLNERRRGIAMLVWMKQAFHLSPSTFMLSVSLYDRFLDTYQCDRLASESTSTPQRASNVGQLPWDTPRTHEGEGAVLHNRLEELKDARDTHLSQSVSYDETAAHTAIAEWATSQTAPSASHIAVSPKAKVVLVEAKSVSLQKIGRPGFRRR